MIEVYDAHCHYAAAINSSNQHLAVASIEPDDIVTLVTLRNSNAFAKIGCGLHPWYIGNDNNLTQISSQLETYIIKYQPNFIGECGLDKLKDNFALQLEVCEIHCQLATKYNLPIVFHCVRAYNELLQLIAKYPKLTGLIHGYNANTEMAKQFISKNFKLGIGSLIMNDTSQVSKSIQRISLDSIVIETDSPYMPMPNHEKSTTADVTIYCAKLADRLTKNPDELVIKVNQNWCDLFT